MMNMNYQRSWPMNAEYYNTEVNDYAAFQALQMQNNSFVDQLSYISAAQPQMNIPHPVYNQQSNPPSSYFLDYQNPVQLPAAVSRKARSSASKSVKRERQLRRNERERERQARLNSAFDVLRGSIPSFLAPYKHEQKLTQIETLRLAKYYISSLKGMLEDNDEESSESDGESEGTCGSKKSTTESLSSSDAGSS